MPATSHPNQHTGKINQSTKLIPSLTAPTQLCTEAVFEPIVFLTKPYSIRANVAFGDLEDGQKGCPKNQTRLVLHAIADVAAHAADAYRSSVKSDGERSCPREVLKFQPPALISSCRRHAYTDWTTIRNYALNMSLHNVSGRHTHLQLSPSYSQTFHISIAVPKMVGQRTKTPGSPGRGRITGNHALRLRQSHQRVGQHRLRSTAPDW